MDGTFAELLLLLRDSQRVWAVLAMLCIRILKESMGAVVIVAARARRGAGVGESWTEHLKLVEKNDNIMVHQKSKHWELLGAHVHCSNVLAAPLAKGEERRGISHARRHSGRRPKEKQNSIASKVGDTSCAPVDMWREMQLFFNVAYLTIQKQTITVPSMMQMN